MQRPFAPCALLAAVLALTGSPAGASGARGASPARQGDRSATPPPARSVNKEGSQGGNKERPAREVVTRSGLRYLDLHPGHGVEAAAGKTVDILYTGWLEDGTRFDASQDPTHPFTFRLGIDEVIKGWHEGIAGMKAGGRRRLVIPAELGYGKQGAGGVVPPSATLVFEIELLDVR